MGYLEKLQQLINNRNFEKFLPLWEEYCTNDNVDVPELKSILNFIKSSDLVKPFGKVVETALPLWQMIENEQESFDILSLLIDLQTTNSQTLYSLALEALNAKYSSTPHFQEKLRQVHMRGGGNFQGALSNFTLLSHMAVGKYVFHSGGWGTGEIVDISSLREQVTIEFENLSGRKHLTFSNAFKALIPLPDEHILARRFADADKLEREMRADPVGVIKLLLSDLGPLSAAEIKDELSDWVIPEKEWARWWQNTRSKLKKDTMVKMPENLRDSFQLRTTQLSHEERLLKAITESIDINETILTAYNFVRDFPSLLKNSTTKKTLQETFLNLLNHETLTGSQRLQIYLFLENQLGCTPPREGSEQLILSLPNIEKVIDSIDILAFKKRALKAVHSLHAGWANIFLNLLFTEQQSTLREYLLQRLNQSEEKLLTDNLQKLLNHPQENPEMFFWYFQLLIAKGQSTLPFSNQEGVCQWLEGLLILFHYIEFKEEYRSLAKKIYLLLSGKRYAVVRKVIEGTTLEFLKEFLLLASKCQSFSSADIKTLRSLAAVVEPSLSTKEKSPEETLLNSNVLWTTEKACLKIQERIKHIATTETVANAKEIEDARALGDLRENSEYKFALEKRSRLQGELKTLSEQLQRARIITKADTNNEIASIGSIVDLSDTKGKKISYALLGPWDADPDQHILSIHSKLGQKLLGCSPGDQFSFLDEEYKVVGLKTIFD